jgi:predicted permease
MGNSRNAIPKSRVLTLRLYRALANAFPHEFKDVYGRELLDTAEDSIDSVWREHGFVGLARLLIDIAIRIPAEYAAEVRQDVQYGLRILANSPGFTAVALISLSLGICIATCAISDMNAIALRTLPSVPDPEQLTAVLAPTSYPNYERYRQESKLFSSTAAYVAPVPFAVVLGGRSERTWGQLVSSSYFSTFETRPFLGRLFDLADEQPGRAPTVILSYRYWQEHLGGDPALIGKTLSINGHPATLIGITAEEFLGASPFLFAADLWMPFSVGPAVAPELSDDALHRRDISMFHVVARLQPGVTRDQAEAALDAITQQLQQDNAEEGKERKGHRVLLAEGGKMLPLREQDRPFFTSFLLLLAGLVMLIACSNVANMMLARATDRRREIAVRHSLGASRARIVRQLLTENLMVATVAGLIGFLGSMWLIHLLSHLRMPFPMPVEYDLRPDGRVLAITLGITFFTGLFFGLAPALQATGPDIAPALKEGGVIRLRRMRGLSLRNLLMVSQIAGSLTLLVLLGVLSLGIQTTMGMQAGFNASNLYLISVDPVRDGLARERVADFFDKLLDRVQKLSGITSACLTETVPVSLPTQTISAGLPESGSKRILESAARHTVGKDYFSTTGIAIHMGRAFMDEDETKDTNTVIVSESFVRQMWKGQNPIGRQVQIGNASVPPPKIVPDSFDYRSQEKAAARTYEVVGVAGDVAEGLVVRQPRPAVYFPLRPADYDRPSLEGVTLIVRTVPGTDALSAIERQIAALSGTVSPFNAMSMQEHIQQFMSPLRTAAWTYAAVGFFGLILASVGLAGMTAYSVTQRRHEIALRMALGARSRDVLQLVVKQAATLVIVGTLIGMALAWAGERALMAMSASVQNVNSTSSTDPIVLIGAPVLLATLALIACYLPARRSVTINPVVALRQE